MSATHAPDQELRHFAIPCPAQLPILGRYVSESSAHSRYSRDCRRAKLPDVSMATRSLSDFTVWKVNPWKQALAIQVHPTCKHVDSSTSATNPGLSIARTLPSSDPRPNPRSVCLSSCPVGKRASSLGFDITYSGEVSAEIRRSGVHGVRLGSRCLRRWAPSGVFCWVQKIKRFLLGRAQAFGMCGFALFGYDSDSWAAGRMASEAWQDVATQEGNILKNYGFGPEAARPILV